MLKIECSCGERYEFKPGTIFNRNRNECPNCGEPFLADPNSKSDGGDR